MAGCFGNSAYDKMIERDVMRYCDGGVEVDGKAFSAFDDGTLAVFRVLEHGEEKHPDADFTKHDAAHHIRAALGHLERYQDGQVYDEDSGEHNLAHVIARMMLAMYQDVNK